MRVTFKTSVRGNGFRYQRGQTADVADDRARDLIARRFAVAAPEPTPAGDPDGDPEPKPARKAKK